MFHHWLIYPIDENRCETILQRIQAKYITIVEGWYPIVIG